MIPTYPFSLKVLLCPPKEGHVSPYAVHPWQLVFLILSSLWNLCVSLPTLHGNIPAPSDHSDGDYFTVPSTSSVPFSGERFRGSVPYLAPVPAQRPGCFECGTHTPCRSTFGKCAPAGRGGGLVGASSRVIGPPRTNMLPTDPSCLLPAYHSILLYHTCISILGSVVLGCSSSHSFGFTAYI